MVNNDINGGIDKSVWMAVFEGMTPIQRRWAFISVKMAERRKTFKDMAKRHGQMGAWYMSECAQGLNGRKITSKIKHALEVELGIDLDPFLSPEETWKMEAEKNIVRAGKNKKALREEAI